MILWAIINYNISNKINKYKTLHLTLHKIINKTKCERLENIYQFRILKIPSVLITFQTTQIYYQHLTCFIFGETSGSNRDEEGNARGTVFQLVLKSGQRLLCACKILKYSNCFCNATCSFGGKWKCYKVVVRSSPTMLGEMTSAAEKTRHQLVK